MQTALELVVSEREHQRIRGYDARHDDLHIEGELAQAAACYAVGRDIFTVEGGAVMDDLIEVWPFEGDAAEAVEGKDRQRCLVIAAALLVAEIERLQRAGGR